jgi:hypothetical protein
MRGLNRKLTVLLVACAAAARAAAPTAPAEDDARKFFDSVFGAEARKVAASADAKDDAAFAAKLLESAAALKDTPKFQVVLYEKAYEFGLKDATGYATAVNAMRLLAELAPDRKAECQEKLLAAYQHQYKHYAGAEKAKAGQCLVDALVLLGEAKLESRKPAEAVALYRQAYVVAGEVKSPRAEELWRTVKSLTVRQENEQKAMDLKSRLEKNPEDRALRTALIQLYVVELDSPAEAAKFLDAGSDEATRTYVPLGAKEVNEVAEPVCAQLGDWYRSLAGSAIGDAKVAMLRRAKTYYGRFLELHMDQDAPAQKAKASLEEVKRELEKLEMQTVKLFDTPKVLVLKAREFADKHEGSFPQKSDLARGAKVTASSQFQRRSPDRAFQGFRAGTSWMLNGPAGSLEAKWEDSIRGRYVLLFVNAGQPGKDPWGEATMTVNGAKVVALKGVSAGHVVLVDFGGALFIRSLRIDIRGQGTPGIAGVEVHQTQVQPK